MSSDTCPGACAVDFAKPAEKRDFYFEAVQWIIHSRQHGYRPRAVAMSEIGLQQLLEDPRVFRWSGDLGDEAVIHYDGEPVHFFARR